MNFSTRATLLVLSTVVVTLFRFSAFPAAASAGHPASQDDESQELNLQVDTLVHGSLRKHSEAISDDQWRHSGHTPHDVFARVASMNSFQASNALCLSLANLSDEELSFFEDELKPSPPAKPLACAAKLIPRIEKHWKSRKEELEHIHPREILPELSLLGKSRGPAPGNPETTEKRVDVSQGPVFSDGGLNPGEITISLDDGPHPSRTARILEILKSHGARANFFEIGENAQANPQVSRRVFEAGHIVGSHTWSHADLPKIGEGEAFQEINRGREAVSTATGETVPFFRFPYGDRSEPLNHFVKGEAMASFLWNMDSLDWKIRDPQALFKNVMAELKREKGGIILFHDIHEQTVIVLPHFLDELRKGGYKLMVFVPR